jgi:hypothetical protein
MDKHILVASYYFPPYPGIGGRRMAKFCKYLVQRGYTVHVINVENPHTASSAWTEETRNEHIRVYSLPLCYPRALSMDHDTQKKSKSLFSGLAYRLVHSFYSLTQKKRVYDLTFLWEKQFTSLAETLIRKHNIVNFIVSVSPHYYSLYASRLKKRFPHLNLIIDFRDPWITLRDFGLQSMSARQKESEKNIISETVSAADYLISPSSFVLNEFKPYLRKDDHLIEIPHAYDWDDIEPFINEQTAATPSDLLHFIYPGTLYTDILPSLLKLNEALNEIKNKHPLIYHKIRFDFYVDEQHYGAHFKEHSHVKFHKPVGKNIFEKVSRSSVILILYAEHNKDYRTTKFYEFMPFRKPYLYIGPKGNTYDFIENYKLGRSFFEKEPAEKIAAYIVALSEGTQNYDPLMDSDDFSFSRQTDRLISLFK